MKKIELVKIRDAICSSLSAILRIYLRHLSLLPSSALFIPEVISESVLGAADVCQEIYKDLLSQFLISYSTRWAALQASNPLEASLDPHIVSCTSLALFSLFVKRMFSLTQKVLQDNIVSFGGLPPNESFLALHTMMM